MYYILRGRYDTNSILWKLVLKGKIKHILTLPLRKFDPQVMKENFSYRILSAKKLEGMIELEIHHFAVPKSNW